MINSDHFKGKGNRHIEYAINHGHPKVKDFANWRLS